MTSKGAARTSIASLERGNNAVQGGGDLWSVAPIATWHLIGHESSLRHTSKPTDCVMTILIRAAEDWPSQQAIPTARLPRQRREAAVVQNLCAHICLMRCAALYLWIGVVPAVAVTGPAVAPTLDLKSNLFVRCWASWAARVYLVPRGLGVLLCDGCFRPAVAADTL